MSTTDAPDWQEIVVLAPGSGLPDSPDWQNTVTGPGGTQPVTTGGASFLTPYTNSGFLGATIDPLIPTGGIGITSPSLTLLAFGATVTGPVHNIYVPLTAGAVYTANQTYAGIYDFGNITPSTFTLLATSASGAA